ncbi:O-acetyl-ADP-ribose deacetylase [bioreactor metagenome]|uniref:O-acetyl-ADP-ribose deacetylase n=1 Tax=bioreactor metagenome TaxID=1076179 RepID=A0A645BAT6_9ZZZZ
MGGGGVDGAIHRAAGKELLEECEKLNGCKTGEAKITGGYRLNAKYVIHTPGPIWRGGNRGEDDLLASCYRNCLQLAVDNGIKTIAFPSISTGVYRFPIEQAAEIAVNEILKFLYVNEQIDVVQLVCYDENTYKVYKKAYENAII